MLTKGDFKNYNLSSDRRDFRKKPLNLEHILTVAPTCFRGNARAVLVAKEFAHEVAGSACAGPQTHWYEQSFIGHLHRSAS